MKNNETKCKDVLRWQCVLRCYFVPSKTFSRNKTYKIVHLVPLKTFSRNKTRGTSDFLTFMTWGSGKEKVMRLATLRVPFLCSLPEGPLHASWSSRPEAVGLFHLKALTGASSWRPSNEKARRDAPSFMTFAERRRFELLIPFRGIHAFQACLLSHSSISPITTLSAHETRKQDCKYTNYL